MDSDLVQIELTKKQVRDLSRDLEHLVHLSPATFYNPRSAISKLRKLVWLSSERHTFYEHPDPKTFLNSEECSEWRDLDRNLSTNYTLIG